MMRRAFPSMIRSALFLLVGVLAAPSGSAAQETGEGMSPYADATARALHRAALAERERVDSTVLAYTAVIRQRIAAALRMPLKDRTLYRSEASHRLWWRRDDENLVQVLAYREQTPVGVDEEDLDLDRFETAFDPTADRLFFGFASREEDLGEPDSDDFWFEHPLDRRYTDVYRFSTGDTITLSLPDGRTVQAVELRVVPREADVHRMTGALWIEPGSGALVRAVYRLSDTFDAFRDIPDLQEEEGEDLSFIPGLLKPWTVDISMISVDYGLWDFSVWMPRSMRMEGMVAAGILKAPITFDYAYELESVETTRSGPREGEAAVELPTVHFATRSEAMAYLNELAFGREVSASTRSRRSSEGDVVLLVPDDRTFLRTNPELPPPVWEAASGFSSDEELRQSFDVLADLPQAPRRQTPTTFRWGLQRPDLLRFNRVEGLSVGARGQARPSTFLGPLSVTLTGRLGYADLVPNAHLEVARESLRRRIAVHGYHELTSIEPESRHLGLGNSVMALLFGRDDGDYFRRSGASLEWTPPSARRRSYRVTAYAERHRAVGVETDVTVRKLWDDDWAFRPNLPAQEGWEYGGTIELSPWWGTDPRLVQGGLDVSMRAATGMTDFARGALVGRLAVPLPWDLRLAVEAGGGTTVGTPSIQRLWFVGGPRTLRGYPPRILGGEQMVRGRGEVARRMPFGSLSLFSDYAWAGDGSDFALDDGFYSVGLGLSIVDGLIRLDAGYGLRAPRDLRIDLYLDSML